MCPPQRHLRAFPPQITLAGGHRCTEQTLIQAFPSWTTTSLERVRIIKVAVKLWHSWPVQTQIVRGRNGFRGLRDFPHVIVYFVNEWVTHNAMADKLERHTDKSFGPNKKVPDTHQQMVTTSASGGLGRKHYSRNSIWERMKPSEKRVGESVARERKKHTNMLIGSGQGAWCLGPLWLAERYGLTLKQGYFSSLTASLT